MMVIIGWFVKTAVESRDGSDKVPKVLVIVPKSPRHRSQSPGRRSKSPRHRSQSPGRRSKSPRRRSKSPGRLPKYTYGFDKAFAPKFDKYVKELTSYNSQQKKELLHLAILHDRLSLVKKLLDMGIKPGKRIIKLNQSFAEMYQTKRAKDIQHLLKKYKT